MYWRRSEPATTALTGQLLPGLMRITDDQCMGSNTSSKGLHYFFIALKSMFVTQLTNLLLYITVEIKKK